MYGKVILLLCAIKYCLGQNINSPELDWIQTDGTGAYRFGYATGDEGRHYRVETASADNQVVGKFGYKDPKTGNDLQTTYTAGRRGFRARGPHIARRMDLSQNKPPFSRPNDDGQYHPELDNYFDPNESKGYDFSYKTPDHIKEEHANRVGDVQGRYAYLDDLGFRHNVQYIAGSKTGFVVTNSVPDTFSQARGGPLYYVGKTGGSKVRGYSALQKNLNGAYRFLASGPDHKRSEISDASGNRRGVYTYLDDKGVQHTVEYIAGPKIGYKVINNKRGFNYKPIIPYFPDTSTIFPLLPSSPGAVSSTPFPTLPSSVSSSNTGTGAGTFSPPSFGSDSGNAFGGVGGGGFDTNDFNTGIGGFGGAGDSGGNNYGSGGGNSLGGGKGPSFGGGSGSGNFGAGDSGGESGFGGDSGFGGASGGGGGFGGNKGPGFGGSGSGGGSGFGGNKGPGFGGSGSGGGSGFGGNKGPGFGGSGSGGGSGFGGNKGPGFGGSGSGGGSGFGGNKGPGYGGSSGGGGGFGSDGGSGFESGGGSGFGGDSGNESFGSGVFPSIPPSGNRPSGGSFSSSHPTISTGISHTTSPSLFTPSSGKPPHSLFQPSSGKSSSVNTPNKVPPHSFEKPSNFPSTTHGYPKKPQSSGDFDFSTPKWSYDYDYYVKDPANSNKDWSKPAKGHGTPTSTPIIPFDPFPDFPPSPFPEPPFLPDPFDENLNTAESSAGLKPRPETQNKHDCKNDSSTTFEHDGHNKIGGKDTTDQKSFSNSGKNTHEGSIKHYYKGTKSLQYPSRGTVKFGGVRKNEWRKVKSEDGYFAIPPGVAVRAHVQSLDIVPYNKRYLPPGEALENHESNDKKEDDSN